MKFNEALMMKEALPPNWVRLIQTSCGIKLTSDHGPSLQNL